MPTLRSGTEGTRSVHLGATRSELDCVADLSDHMVHEQRSRTQVPLRACCGCDRKSFRRMAGSLVLARPQRRSLAHHAGPTTHRVPRLRWLAILLLLCPSHRMGVKQHKRPQTTSRVAETGPDRSRACHEITLRANNLIDSLP
jgi:hypothetical protein